MFKKMLKLIVKLFKKQKKSQTQEVGYTYIHLPQLDKQTRRDWRKDHKVIKTHVDNKRTQNKKVHRNKNILRRQTRYLKNYMRENF